MSFNDLFGNQSHTHHKILKDPTQANLGTKLNKVRDRRHATQEIPLFNIGNSVSFTPVSAYGATLLDTTSLADLRATILENTNEEAIRLLADGNNEINFYTGGTGASNLKLQVLNSSIDVKNSATLNTANVVVGTNNHIKQKIEDSGDRVLVESTGKVQYCLYSYAAGTNSGLLIQSATVNNIMEINNYENGVGYRPISINRSTLGSVNMGTTTNPTSINTANFVSNGESVFCNGASPLLHISSSNIKPYTSIIPNGVNAEDLGNATNYFGQTHTNKVDVKSDMFMNIFGSSNLRNTGFFFRSGFGSGSGIQDNMCIRGFSSPANDGLMVSAYGGISLNCGQITVSNDNGLNGATNRAMLINTTINNHVNMLPSADGTLNIGSSGLKFGDIYGNNIRAHTNLYTDQIRPYTASPVHFHNTSITSDSGNSIAIDRIQSTALGTDLFLGNDSTSKLVVKGGASGNVELLAPALTPAIDQTNSLGDANKRFADMRSLKFTASTKVVTPEIENGGNPVECNGVFRASTNNTRTLGDGTNRWSEVFATNGTINTSDRNSKKDITPITGALQFVRRLKPVQYKWKENSHGRTHTGFIAQDVLEANPLGLRDNWSGYIDTGNGLGLRYAEFISINTQAIKEMDEKLKILAIRVNNGDCGEGVKVDLNYHTDSSEIIERLEILENRELSPITEEYDDSEMKEEMKKLKIEMIDLKIENKKQEDCISQLIADNMNLSKKLEMLMEKFEKFDETPNVGMKIEDNSDMILSEGGDLDMMENVQERLHNVEQKITKLSNKQAKLVTAVNKLKK